MMVFSTKGRSLPLLPYRPMVFMCVALWMWTWAWTWHIYSTSTMEDSLTPRFINHSITHHLAQTLFPLISIYLHISSHYLATSQLCPSKLPCLPHCLYFWARHRELGRSPNHSQSRSWRVGSPGRRDVICGFWQVGRAGRRVIDVFVDVRERGHSGLR